MSKIMFSYRATDSKAIAVRVLDRLKYNYGSDDVHEGIKAAQGQRRSYVEDFLKTFSVLVTVIGPNWLNTRSRAGIRRIDDTEDFVRLEIEVALEKGIPIIPVLVRDAEMPDEHSLPDEIKSFASLEPLHFGHEADFRGGMIKLHRLLAQKIVLHDVRRTAEVPDDTPPTQARKDMLNGVAATRSAAGKPPFEAVRIETLGEVQWILGAGSGRLGKLYGERRFPPDLSGADLSFVNLSGSDLRGAKLANAKLVQANLSKVNLLEGVLTGADLTEANLINARLDRAVLSTAKLQLADLSACSLQGADLTKVNLTTTKLAKAVMHGAIMQQANFTSLELPDAQLNNADLTGADLQDVTMPRAQLKEAKLEGCKLAGADLTTAVLIAADLSHVTLDRTDLSSANLSRASIRSVDEIQHVIIDESTCFDEVNWGGRQYKDPKTVRDREQRLRAYRETAQTNHDLAEVLRKRGFLVEASAYRLREQKMRRGVLRTNRRYGAWLFSSILNIISGYGERIGRTVTTYLAVVIAFALAYFIGTNYLNLEADHLSLYQALIQSVVSFHGRGFVTSALQLGDPMSGITVLESVSGLFIEGIFIATFSRRFLGD